MSDMSARDRIDALEVLVGSDGWALVVERVNEQVKSYTNMILAGDIEHDRYVQACAERAMALGLLEWPHKTIAHLTKTEGDA